MQRTNRRQFLCITAGFGGFVAAGAGSWLLSRGQSSNAVAAASPPSGPLHAATRTSWALGSDVSMTVLHVDADAAERALDEAFGELELVEQLMSIYRPDSQLCRLNADGVLDYPHPYFVEVLRAAERMSQASGGAFDVTVQPLWQVYTDAKKAGRLPDPHEVEQARTAVDWRRVELADDCIRLRGAGTAITFNGIAQGFAADRATAVLKSCGVEHALVNTGEIGALGPKEDGRPWTVGIQHPRHDDAYVSLVKLAGRSLATSGDYHSSFSADHRLNHLFDPRTGCSPTELASVSIAASSSMQADALSTAVFVLGPAAGLSLVRSTPGADALLVLKNGRTMMTDGFPIEA